MTLAIVVAATVSGTSWPYLNPLRVGNWVMGLQMPP